MFYEVEFSGEFAGSGLPAVLSDDIQGGAQNLILGLHHLHVGFVSMLGYDHLRQSFGEIHIRGLFFHRSTTFEGLIGMSGSVDSIYLDPDFTVGAFF